MAYLPQNKYKTYYTDGKGLKIKSTNKPYKGPYIITAGWKTFCGRNPPNTNRRINPYCSTP